MSGRSRGNIICLAAMILSDNPASRQVGNDVSHNGGAMRAPVAGPTDPKGNPCPLFNTCLPSPGRSQRG